MSYNATTHIRTLATSTVHRRISGLAGALLMVLALSACSSSPTKADEAALTESITGGTVNANAIREFEEAVVAFEGADLVKAKAHLERAIKEDGRFGKAWFNLGVLHELNGDKDEARKSYQKALEFAPKLGAAYVNLGLMAINGDERDAAWDMFQKAVEVQPYNPEAQNNISVILRERKQYAEAVNHARRSLAGDSQNTKPYANLAHIYYDRGNYDVAKLVMLNAVQIDEKDADLYNILGLIELAQNDVTAAIAYFQRTLKLRADHVPALLNLGAIILNVRDYERAVTLFETALQHRPNDIEALISIAVAKRGLGDLAGARQYYDKVIALDANNAMVQFNLGVLEHEHMAQNAQMGVGGAEPPEDPIEQMDWNIANMKSSITHYEKALEHYRQYLYLDKSDNADARKEANDRIGQVSQIIQMTNEQMPLMDQQKDDMRNQLKEQAEWEAQQAAGEGGDGAEQ
ncbi:MAG: tetratricopeptide repeat protein [Bradymonadaceae bacterium]|nr:tetratricopeptide repeat protein [Lujinxingiaceae bacterium]